jgi:hypothetical protein
MDDSPFGGMWHAIHHRRRRVPTVADELLARNRSFVNRISQVFLLAMGIWFLWTGFAG